VIAASSFHLSFLFLVLDAKGGEDCILACVLRVVVSLSVKNSLKLFISIWMYVRLCVYFLSRI
jgi:hypothetical protein